MRKFECKKCLNNCILTVEEHYMELRLCPYSSFPLYADWHEVVDNAENEQFGNSEQLPDWAKVGVPQKKEYSESFSDLPKWAAVGKWICNIKNHEYFKILHLNQLAWISDEIKNGDYIEARKRPFNEVEMQALVGKIIDCKDRTEMIVTYHAGSCQLETMNNVFSPHVLMDSGFTIDGKPCYKLEHLENGEWVE